MVTLQQYETITGYTPVHGEPCPECKAICGPGGPDHHGTCSLMAKVWFHEKSPNAAIQALPGLDVHDPKFGPWASKLASSLLSGQSPAIPKGGPPPPQPVAPAAVPAPLTS